MRNFIRNLRAKPESDRRRFLLLSSVGITLIIVLIWLVSFTNSYLFNNGAAKTTEVNPVSILKSNLGAVYESFGK